MFKKTKEQSMLIIQRIHFHFRITILKYTYEELERWLSWWRACLKCKVLDSVASTT